MFVGKIRPQSYSVKATLMDLKAQLRDSGELQY